VLSWTVPSVKRGSGIGKAMVRLVADSIDEEVRAEIRQGNIASVHIAEAAGLKFEREVDGMLHYRRSATRA
jgi:RimJ/RimL family protein N-acetyltransferase